MNRLGAPATLVVDAVGISRTVVDALAASGLGSRIVLVGMGSPRLELDAYALSTAERALIGSFTYSAAEFADTAEWVGTVPEGIDALIDGRVDLEGRRRASTTRPRAKQASKILVFPQGNRRRSRHDRYGPYASCRQSWPWSSVPAGNGTSRVTSVGEASSPSKDAFNARTASPLPCSSSSPTEVHFSIMTMVPSGASWMA